MAEYIERTDLEFPYMTMTLWGLNQETCRAYNEGVKAAADYIASIPAADVAPVVHGRWECEHETWGRLQCSNCKKEALLEKSNGDVGTILLYVTSNYCPNCGTKMYGGNNVSET